MRLRHPRGRGLILEDAEVSISAYLSQDSTASGSCQIRDARVEKGSIVADQARVFGGQLYRTFAGGKIVLAGDPEAENCILTGKSLTGLASLYHTITKDSAEVADRACIVGDSLSEPIVIADCALVYGNAFLNGHFFLNKKMRVHEGKWTRAPKHVDLGYTSLTECIDGKIILDCRCRTKEYWLRHGAKLGKRFGWTEEQINSTLLAIQQF